MQIAVIGAGRVGCTLGGRWRDAGHHVTYGVRDPQVDRHRDLGPVASPAEAIEAADVIVIALPWAAVEDVVSGLDVGDAIVVDATNPLASNARDLEAHAGSSGASLIAGWTGSTRVVKAFNTTGSANMADPTYREATPVMLLAGDDEEAKGTVSELASQLGFEPVDAGPLSAAGDLEHVAALWIRLAYRLGHGPDIAFALLHR